MSAKSTTHMIERLVLAGGLALALGTLPPTPVLAQQSLTDEGPRPGAAAPGRRRCRTCAPIPAPSARPSTNAASRSGGGHTPSTDATITLGSARYQGRVDADCELREGAPVGGPRMYYLVMYPWFGRPVGADEPKWRFDLEIQRGATPGVYQHFVFSFQDGTRSGHIQVLPGATRYGRGTVRVTPRPPGARFEVEGVSDEGVPLRASIDCVAFQSSEGAGG